LHHPPERFGILAQGALDFCFWHSAEVLFFFSHYNDFFIILITSGDSSGLFQRFFPFTFWTDIASFLCIGYAKRVN
jgi:hypothetical protein